MISELIDFKFLMKNLKKCTDGFKVVKVAILADSASQFVVKAVKGAGIENQINYEIFEADYNQISRQVFDTNSELYKYEPEFVIILRSSEKLLKQFYSQSTSDKSIFSEQQVAFTSKLYSQIKILPFRADLDFRKIYEIK